MRLEIVAASRVVANGRCGPDVVHGPYHSLVGVKNLPYAFQREHSLVYPVQVYDICLAELPQSGDVRAGVGNVYLEEVVFAEMGMEKDHEALPKETPLPP